MAKRNLSHPSNVEGNFFVDSTCINCGTCYWISPTTFKVIDGYSHVFHQPNNQKSLDESYRALYSCPTNSIGVTRLDEQSKQTLNNLPFLIEDDIYHTGFHSEKSFGATSYFIKRDQGNILIDSPRYFKRLSKKLQKLGGIKLQLLTHKDDVADTNLYHKDFLSKRFIHIHDKNNRSKDFEEFINQTQPFDLDSDIKVIPTPGHTKGSICFLYKKKYLFTGDHLAFSTRLNHLYAFKYHCWYDLKQQIESLELLLDYNFTHVLPGHSAPMIGSSQQVKESLKKCISWMKS